MLRRSWSSALALGLVVAASSTGCKGKGSGAPRTSPSTESNDHLLSLAPADAKVAVVASGRALAQLDSAVARLRQLARTDAAVADGLKFVDEALTKELGLPGGVQLASLGLTSDRGLALFVLPDDRTISIWPVADRAAFRAAFRGKAGSDGADDLSLDGHALRCREAKGVYACADDLALLDQLGTGSLAGKPAAAGARGDIEVVASFREEQTTNVAATVVLDGGGLIARLRMTGPAMMAMTALAQATVTLPAGRASGLFGLALSPSMLGEPDDGPLGAVLSSVRGDVTGMVPSGVADLDVRVPLKSSGAVRALLDQCDRFPLPDDLTATRDGDGCLLSVKGDLPFTASVRVVGDVLRISRSRRDPDTAGGPAPTALGRELASTPWTMAVWGRGSSLAVADAGAWSGLGANPGVDAALMALALGYLTEFGLGLRVHDDGLVMTLGVRTALGNPPAVIDALAPLVARMGRGEDVSAQIAALAAAHPGTPFADDFAAGHVGLMVPVAGIGMLAAVVIPKFLDYMKASKRSEAELNLNAISKAAMAEYYENSTFPIGAAELSPAAPCCEGPGRKCPVQPAAWNGVPAWDALGFEMTEPHFFQYSYRGDGRSYVATAVGDLDCDGNTVTYTLTGAIDAAGNPTAELQRPTRAD